MATSFSNGSVNILGTVQATTTPPALTALWGTKVGVGNTTVGTVPAGKVWKIYGAVLNIAHSALASGYFYIGNPVGTVKMTVTCGANNSATAVFGGGYLTAVAADNVIVSVTAGTGDLTIYYVQEDA